MTVERRTSDPAYVNSVRRRAEYPTSHFFGEFYSGSFFPIEEDIGIAERCGGSLPFQAECSLPPDTRRGEEYYLAKAFTPGHLDYLGKALRNCLNGKLKSTKLPEYWRDIRRGETEVFAVIRVSQVTGRGIVNKATGATEYVQLKKRSEKPVAAFSYFPVERKIGPVMGWGNWNAVTDYQPQIQAALRFVQSGVAYDMQTNTEYRRGRKR